MDIPPQFSLPRSFEECYQMLDERCSRLLVYFKLTTFFNPEPYWGRVLRGHLANCQLRNYDFYDVNDEARLPSDVAYYFIRRET